MKKVSALLLILTISVSAGSSCNLPGMADTPSANTGEPAVTEPLVEETLTSQPRSLQLDHLPLYWFAPLPPL